MRCKNKSKTLYALALLTGLSVVFVPAPLSAQNGDRNIVNEPKAADDLRDAIRRVGRRPTDSVALYDAGDAALKLGDPITALEFFQRAERLTPSSARVKAGLARAQLKLERPVEAIKLFDQSIVLGISPPEIALDRGLAFDLIGNFSRAQQEYHQISASFASNDLTIRQAISYSLSGNEDYADGLLLPLLRANDPAAWRARSFLLAARGETKESYQIAQGFLSKDDAKSLRPYLKSMKRLTGAQQAAAVHFGRFPSENLIGKDDRNVRIASANNPVVTVQSDRLKPAGKPLGIDQETVLNGKIKDEKNQQIKTVNNFSDDNKNITSRAAGPVKPIIAIDKRETKTASSTKLIEASESDVKISSVNSETTKIASLDSGDIGISNVAEKETRFSEAAVSGAEKKELDLDDFISTIEISDEEKKTQQVVDLDSIKAEQKAKREAEKKEAERKRKTKIAEQKAAAKKKEEAAKKAETEKNRARYWVQLATGRDKDALHYDYRRISRKQKTLFKGKSGAISKWGSTNRLVVGPFENLKSAKKFESEFRKGGGDGFVWRSANGTIVTPMK